MGIKKTDKRQKQFERLEVEYGCGYWNVCWEHACPCRVSIESNGKIDKKIYKSLIEEARKVVEQDELEYENL